MKKKTFIKIQTKCMLLQSCILHDYEQFMNVHWSPCLRRFRKNCCSAQLSGEGPYVKGSQIYHLHGAFPNARASILCEVTHGPHCTDGQLERSDTVPFPLLFTGSMEAISSHSIHWKKKPFKEYQQTQAWWHTPVNPALGFHHLERRWKSGVNYLN